MWAPWTLSSCHDQAAHPTYAAWPGYHGIQHAQSSSGDPFTEEGLTVRTAKWLPTLDDQREFRALGPQAR